VSLLYLYACNLPRTCSPVVPVAGLLLAAMLLACVLSETATAVRMAVDAIALHPIKTFGYAQPFCFTDLKYLAR
jgi:hypothetical protein